MMHLRLWILFLCHYTLGTSDSVEGNPYREVNGTVIRSQTFTRTDGPYLVTSDLVVAHNATLTVEAGSEVLFVPNVGIRVYGSLVAKGTHSQRISFRAIPCNQTNFCSSKTVYNPGIRLVDGTSFSNGRLEILWNGQWGTICDAFYWDYRDTEVACRQLGFLGAIKYYNYPGSSGPIWIARVSCKGNEESLWQCGYLGVGQTGCSHYGDVGIECDRLIPFLTERVYWKGIHFSPSNITDNINNSSLENVDITNAFEGIEALKKAPDLFNITIRDGFTGLLVRELEEPLRVVDSKFLRCDFVGVNVTTSGAPVAIQNVSVQNTKYGNGLVYKQIADDVDLCSIVPEEASFPLVLIASGKVLPSNCSKTFRAPPGGTLSVHFRLITGSEFELNVTDGDTSNKTLLSRVTADYKGKTLKTVHASVLEINFDSKENAKVAANLKIIILNEQGLPSSLLVSNSNFSNNFKNGISIVDLIGCLQISNTVIAQNGYAGLNTVNTSGGMSLSASMFLHNQKHGLYAERITGSVEIGTVESSKNQESGIVINGGTISLLMSDSNSESNVKHGLHISNQLNSTLNVSNSKFIHSTDGRGIYLHDFAEDCIVWISKISLFGNSNNGAFFEKVNATRIIITSSSFDGNGWNGLSVSEVVAGRFALKEISTSGNQQTGVYFSEGRANLHIESWSSVGNNKNGLLVTKQRGNVTLKDCVVAANKRDGLQLLDGAHVRLRAFNIQNCTVSKNRYGILFELYYINGVADYDVTMVDTGIVNNSLGGCEFYLVGCNRNSQHRRVQLSFTGNKVKGNQKFGLYFSGPETYELNATLKNNIMAENTGYALKLKYADNCHRYYPFSVLVNILESTFVQNTGEYIVFVDYNSLPSKRFMTIKNNTFLRNNVVRSFSSRYVRTKTQAVLVLNEGNFTVKHNSFNNPSFPHEMTTLMKDHERVFQARENWWGSSDECKVKEKIFDFEDRVELAQIQYYPFLVDRNVTSIVLHNGARSMCFLQGTKIGGIVKWSVTLPNSNTTYQVTGDLIVLPESILIIEENVTLEFELQAVFLVYGQIIVRGTNMNRVKFTPKNPLQKEIRLVDGPGPWEGRLEVWFNNTWMSVCLDRYDYESAITCRQLGYEGASYLRQYSSGKENAFLHNVRCSSDENDNIANCNRQAWSLLSSCSNYVAYITCKIPYWSGVHLPLTPKKSFITNLDVTYAGFPYRNDLNVPGIALRVDLSHHNISGVIVNNSAYIGVQIMYPDPFKNSYDLQNSTISNTKSDGIRLESPFVDITHTDVVNTKGCGFLSDFNWNSLNTHVVNMAETKAKTYLQMCSDKQIFLDNSNLIYYLVVNTGSTYHCESIITAPQNYDIGMQLIYHDLNSEVFHVYSGKNATSETLWDIHLLAWASRPVWMSNTSSILLERKSRYSGHSVHFVLYLVKGKNHTELTSPNLIISNSNFISNILGGIVLSNGRDILGNVYIQNSVIRDSSGNGLQTAFSSVKNINLLNCTLIGNKNGIVLSKFSGDVTIEYTVVSNSSYKALYVPSEGQKIVHLRNCRFTHNRGYAVHVYGYRTQLSIFATNAFFGWNKATTVLSDPGYGRYEYGIPIFSFKNCTFLMNRGPVINIKESPSLSLWEFVENVFMKNTQPSVIRTTQYTHISYIPKIVVNRNKFLFNLCHDKGVIDVVGGTKKLVIDGNLFEGNSGRSIYLEETSRSPTTVENNIFNKNNCSEKGVLEVGAMNKEINIDNNVFQSNEGLFMVLLNCGYSIELQMINEHVNFTNNSFVNNTNVESNDLSCELSISGLMEHKTFLIHYNKFNSYRFTKELCLYIFASSCSSSIDVSFNFWGYNDESAAQKRIFDAESDYEHALAIFVPFLSRSGNIIYGSNATSGFEVKSILGGRISSTVQLNISGSPYKVLSDVIILPQASLIIDPGVEMQFDSGVGMLVIGSLFVNGNDTHPVTFSLLKKNQSETSMQVRLVGGTFPWYGRVEVLINENWVSLCSNESTPFEMNTAKVVCGQLGYKKPLIIGQNIDSGPQMSLDAMAFSIISSCHGNETEIGECSLTLRNHSCSNVSRAVILNCTKGLPWGNIRFLRELNWESQDDQSKSHLQHLKIEHCGTKHGKEVAALEIFQYVPEVHSVNVLNCSAGGSKIWFPEKDVIFTNASFNNTGGSGAAILTTEKNVTMQQLKSINNKDGVSFGDPNGQWMDGLSYGQIMLCAVDSAVDLANGSVFLYFRHPFITNYNPTVKCKKVVRTGGYGGFAIKLVVMKNVDYIIINDPYRNEILKYSSRDIAPLSRRRLVPWNTVTIYFQGWFSTSEVLLHLERIEENGFPCTFEINDCGWKNYPGSNLNGTVLTSRWDWTDFYGMHSGIPDHTYFYHGSTGNFMWLGLDRWTDEYGAFSGPPVLKEYNYCYLTFYYMLRETGYASLTVFIQYHSGNKLTVLWKTDKTMRNWKKTVLKLPTTPSNYSVVFLGFYSYMYYVHFVGIDDIQFKRCDSSLSTIHTISESTISGSFGHGIAYTSTQSEGHLFRLERSRIMNNGLASFVDGNSPGAVHLNAANQAFRIFNNYFAGNKNGTLYSRLQNEETAHIPPNSQFHANTIESNRGRSLFLEGISGPFLDVKVTDNHFSLNLATDLNQNAHSICKVSNVVALFQGNLFYNNSGQYVLEYEFPVVDVIGLTFVNNTLFRNHGLGVNFGVTILCNGLADMHYNVLENPRNRYQISTSLKGSPAMVNATSNWWGESVLEMIVPLIKDKTKDYRLSLTVIFRPYIQLQPQTAISVSCPPKWIKDDDMCLLYMGGSFNFQYAKMYCESSGGNIISMYTDEDVRLVKELRWKESLVRPTVVPALWTMNGHNFRKLNSESQQGNGICSVIDSYGNITESECDRLLPFVCVRRPVVYCPNGCFHHGDCVGAICFCYSGWTGEDCSEFHCNDLHNCSGNGECMGPNVCKCYPGYLGLGCTYSFCGEYENCADCVTDQFCGWCDSSRSCLGGFAVGPPKINCPDWFYHHCYTVGNESRCSNSIPIVDCTRKHCNYRDGRATIESCQKCNDLEKCYKITNEGQCRTWNESRCPGGQVQVDYTDPQRVKNVQLAKNVKIVEPNTTTIYACPVMVEGTERISLVFVAPKELDVVVGDILCSSQAGGILHKIVTEVIHGPLKLMQGAAAGLEEIITYADFKQETTLKSVEDVATLEDEPDQQDIQDLISGKNTFNESRLIILQSAYKCLGHTYDIGSVPIHSYFLVIENNVTIPRTSDIVVSNASDGFIETVVAVHNTSDGTRYIETKLQQCDETSRLSSKRLIRGFSESAFCSGGDNNPGLIVTLTDDNKHRLAVDNSIVGRPSSGFIAKVVQVNRSDDFLLVEVISANINENGTISTVVDVNNLRSLHRRKRRSMRSSQRFGGSSSFNSGVIKHTMMSSAKARIEARSSLSLSLTASVEIQKNFWGKMENAALGVTLSGSMDSTVEIRIAGALSYRGSLRNKKKRQLGGTKYISFGVLRVPVGFFLEVNAEVIAAVSGSLRLTVSTRGTVNFGGECCWKTASCYLTDNKINLDSNWNQPKLEVTTGASLGITVTPTVSVQMPVVPRWDKKKPPKLLQKIIKKILDVVDLSVSAYASAPLKAGVSLVYPSRQCQQRTPVQLQGYYGIDDLIFGVAVSFFGNSLRSSHGTGFSRMKRLSTCICPVGMEALCVPTDGGQPTESTSPTPVPEGKQKKSEKCLGRPDSECGREHSCAGNRTGPNCTQPDMWPNQNCSGNGKPVIAPNCSAACMCFGGWEGQYCEIISARGGGDPHLETLDGVKFDFFGIGEFWGCKSQRNDFGLQFRLFYYERASLIGGVAVKAGRSLVTVMTIKTERTRDFPIVRIDGIAVNVNDNSSTPIEINNGSVFLESQARFTFEEEENSVVLISLEYESGVTVTVDVKHSRVMKRQFLNVLYSPIAAYKGHTEGLCGFMDNNATNDFMGPDRNIYDSAVQFAESWRITDCHNGSGTRDSWSWNSSNFYHEDTMDLSYTDPSFHPIYSLYGISQSVLKVATSLCKSLGISDNDLQSCIYDVAITNDTTFTDQENFKQGCPDKCSGKGRCVNGTCNCIEGWKGESCNKGSCLNCSADHGNCIKGFCVCDLGWEGRSCELKATCHNVNNCTSPVHGACKTTDLCHCNPGYVGVDCSIVPTCHNVSNCTGNGLCVDFDVCRCDKGWAGYNCTQYSCEHFDYCSERGRCVEFDKCACDLGWTGASCALPDCTAVNQCSEKGECVSSNLCRCYPGFTGTNCSEIADCSVLANCSGQGVCVSLESANVSCSCYAGFTGMNCSQPTCTTLKNCSDHGLCIEAELCKCDQGYNDTDCSNFSCEALNSCSGHGQCIGYDLCNCNPSWSGPACNIPDCSAVKNCSGQGECILVNTCACYPAFDGKLCDQKAKPNINPPSFEHELYNATIKENSPAGTLILQVHANDTDVGRNGEVFYSLLGERSVENLLAIDGATGKVFNSFTFDYETMKNHTFNVSLWASDNGFPQKSGVTIMQVTVTDENDNCPTFVEPSGNLQLDISDSRPGDFLTKVSATDLDNGVNSDITYSLSRHDAFSIDSKTGVITVNSNLTKGEYHLTVGASDNGEISCLTEIRLTIKVISVPTKEPLTKPPTSSTQKTSTASEMLSTSTSSTAEFSSVEPTGTDSTPRSTTATLPTDATESPQKGPNYIVIGVSVFGGLLFLVIGGLLIRKFVLKARPSPGVGIPGKGARVNECYQGDLELSVMSGKL